MYVDLKLSNKNKKELLINFIYKNLVIKLIYKFLNGK